MKAKRNAIFVWSGGKDSALALHHVLAEKQFEVKYLLTTINSQFKRVSMHGVREELIEKQVKSIGLLLIKMYVKEDNNEEYDENMREVLLKAKTEGIHHVIFGDIFLEDLREYRENNLAKVGMEAVFPLWKKDTKELIQEFLNLGYKTISCCINDAWLDETYIGMDVDAKFIQSLPASVDPCGENGEFHTFCYEGPIFKQKISFSIGEKVYKLLADNASEQCNKVGDTKGFWFCDLIPIDRL